MNNRYIFRGKRKDNGEWIEGYYVCNGEHCYIFSGKLGIINKIFDWERYEVIPETVEQCSGVPEKNGKLIFEGDIVKGHWGTLFTIFYDEARLQLMTRSQLGIERDIDYYQGYNDIEVIGNIYDNPELLRSETE